MKEIAKNGWSFCIVSTEGFNENLNNVVKSIFREFKDSENYEIIIIGNSTIYNPKINVKNIFLNSEYIFNFGLSWNRFKKAIRYRSIKPFFYKTGAICHKKNLGVRNAKFNKVCILHDYVQLIEGWRNGFENYGDDWDVCVNKILDKNGERDKDWMLWDHPLLINKNEKIAPCLLPYNLISKYMYISGAYFCVKKDFYQQHPLNENLFWGEGEDEEWSKRVRNKTEFKFNNLSSVIYNKEKVNIPMTNKEWIENRLKLVEIIKDKKKIL